MNYKDVNDYELVYYVRDNNEEASAILYDKYKPLIEKNARKLLKYCNYNGLELNDLIQEGMLGLSKAIESFSESKEASFYTYAKTCVERRQLTAIIASQRQKHKLLNESVSFEAYDDDATSVKTVDAMLVDNSYNPESIMFDYENSTELMEKVSRVLTNFELQVFELKISGFTYIEISEILDKDKKQIDNAIQRIKFKIKDALNK